jgi:hypothetical protein
MPTSYQIQAWLTAQAKAARNGVDYVLADRGDGSGAQLLSWDAVKLGPEPTDDQLATVETQAQALATAATNDRLCREIDAFKAGRLEAGFTDSGAGGTGKTYACDDSSIGRWTAMAASAQPFALGIAPSGVTAATYQPIPTDNSIPSPMSATDVYELFEGRVMPWVAATVIYARTMKNNILAGNAPADITQGWP